MPVFTVTAARPRQELSLAIVEGEGLVPGLIYDEILPDFPINRRTAHIIKATIQDSLGLRHIGGVKYIHAPGTKFERAVAKFADDTLSVVLRGIEIVVPNETQLDYDEFLDVEAFFASRFGREVSGLTKEYLAQAALFNPTTFGAATNSTVAYTSANLATIDFPNDVILSTRRLKAKGEPPPYTLVLAGPVWERARLSTKTLNFVVGQLGPGAEATLDKITTAFAEFGIESISVGDTYYNSAADGATPILAQIWGNTYIWVGRAGQSITSGDNEGVSVPQLGGAGAMLYWEGFSPGGVPSTDKDSQEFEGGNYVESYPDLTIDSMVLRLKMSSYPYIGNARAGDLINPQYS
jgi:hypothetical protein